MNEYEVVVLAPTLKKIRALDADTAGQIALRDTESLPGAGFNHGGFPPVLCAIRMVSHTETEIDIGPEAA